MIADKMNQLWLKMKWQMVAVNELLIDKGDWHFNL